MDIDANGLSQTRRQFMMSRDIPPQTGSTMMKSRIVFLLLLTLLSVATPAQARTYLVELIVFARHAGFGAEHWRSNPGMPATGSAVTLGAAGGGGRFSQLSGSQMELNHIASTLGRNGYRVLKHVGWVQPGLGANKAVAVRISGGGMNGTAKVSLGHYLHLKVDLAYKGGSGGVVRLKQSRRMRSKEVHYLDGPVLGVIALMTPAG